MIFLPKLFEKKLAENPSLAADVRKNLDLFEPWLEQSGMPFFPGFTDHSPRHIYDVLQTASALISDASHALLSAEDVAVLILAILLHDCGMHLTQDGFRALSQDLSNPKISGLGDKPWQLIWADFLSEAQRFGEDKLIAVFGDSEPLSIEKIDIQNLSEKDCLLIGEFVRRHHTRLAHEIAVSNVPTRGDSPLFLQGLDTDIKDMAGLVARSHGMSIRSTFSYLEKKYSRVSEHKRIKAPFLMAVLRIADYVQVQSERAIKTLLSIKELRSPISRQEWKNHFSVNDVSMRHEDPEAMYVHAAPKDAKTFLRLESLFKDIQRELDESWATIGEVYGRLGELGRLGLTVRRLRSNLDDKESFSSTVSYFPMKAGFQSSGPDLLKLLVGPLYDYKHEVGIRELLQNAIDACREIIDIKNLRISEENLPNVTVEIHESEDGTGWVTVTDEGIGMTLETVTKYFLTAGASFRNSDVWKLQHVDIKGQIRVMRGGRFGVGALAAFLMGDEIKVRTRQFERDETEGIEFTARMDEPIVELKKCIAPAGTSVKVFVKNQKIMKALRPFLYEDINDTNLISIQQWDAVDWFSQTIPKVKFFWYGYKKHAETNSKNKLKLQFFPSKQITPNSTEDANDWLALENPEPYKSILIKYEKTKRKPNNKDEPEYFIEAQNYVVVNGIRVQKYYSHNRDHTYSSLWHQEDLPFSLKRPSLAIFDPLGVCPINLQRSSVSFEQMGKDLEITKCVIEDYIKKTIELTPTEVSIKNYLEILKNTESTDGLNFDGKLLIPICATRNGIFFSSSEAFEKLNIKTLYIIFIEKSSDMLLESFLHDDEAIFIRKNIHADQLKLIWFRGIFSDSRQDWYAGDSGLPLLHHDSEAGILLNESWETAAKKGKVSQQIISRVTCSKRNSTHKLVSSGKIDDEKIKRLEEIFKKIDGISEIYSWNIGYKKTRSLKPSLLKKTLDDLNPSVYLLKQ